MSTLKCIDNEYTSQETDTFGANNEKSVVVYNIQINVHLHDSAPMVYCVRRRFNQWLALHEGKYHLHHSKPTTIICKLIMKYCN